jgi:hypothetical protein
MWLHYGDLTGTSFELGSSGLEPRIQVFTMGDFTQTTHLPARERSPLYSGVGIFNWHYLSSPPQIPRAPWVGLERGGLM